MTTKKNIIYGNDAMTALVTGAKKLAHAVAETLGPNGNTVIIENYGTPKVTKDGVSVAKEITLSDPAENLGAQVLISIANRMSVGDGTTSSVLLGYKLIKAMQKIKSVGGNIRDIIDTLYICRDKILELIEQHTVKIDDKPNMIEKVATIAANNDAVIGSYIAQAYDKVGKNGVIMVEESQSGETQVDIINGMQIDKGYCSPHFITNKSKGICELSDAFVLIYDGKISSLKSIISILEVVVRQNKSLLIIAEDVDGEALTGLILNKLHGKIKVVAVKAPSFGDRRKHMLQDLAIVTGAQVISTELGMDLEKVGVEYLGNVSKVTVSKDNAIITTTSESNKTIIDERIVELESELMSATSDYDKTKLKERIAYLSQGIAVIKVGGHSSMTIEETKDRVDDAVNAVQAAARKGIVPGGGALFAYIAKQLDNLINISKSKTGNISQAGISIFQDALISITHKIAKNSKHSNPMGVVDKIQAQNDPQYGYDAKANRYGNMIEFGVVDAALVVESVIKNALDGALSIMQSSVVITNIPEDKSSASDMGMGGMGGMGGMM